MRKHSCCHFLDCTFKFSGLIPFGIMGNIALSSGNVFKSFLLLPFGRAGIDSLSWLNTYYFTPNFDPITQFLSYILHWLKNLIGQSTGYTKCHSHRPSIRSCVESRDSEIITSPILNPVHKYSQEGTPITQNYSVFFENVQVTENNSFMFSFILSKFYSSF